MTIDHLSNAANYVNIHPGIAKAFDYLMKTDFEITAPGKYTIEEEDIFSIVQEYETRDSASEKMESHREYIDVQYMCKGTEQVGLALYNNQSVYALYDAETDFMLYDNRPDFFAKFSQGMFMIFFPTDLHMPCVQTDKPLRVKKVVVKVRV